MNMKDYKPVIRMDDVLQIMKSTTSHQRNDLGKRTLFQAFKDADKVLAKYEYPCTLAVLSEGLNDKDWVAYIKKNLHRYKIELHGMTHHNYQDMRYEDLHYELFKSKELIESAFGVRIKVWYPPFGRRGTPRIGQEVCNNIGFKMYEQVGKVDAKFWFKNPKAYPHINFHYWADYQVKHVEEICHQLAQNS